MSADTTFTAVIDHLERLNNSTDGNPRYRVFTVGGPTRDTAPNADVAYRLSNPEYRGVPVRFTVNGRGWITDAAPVK